MRECEVVSKAIALAEASKAGLTGNEAEQFVERSWRSHAPAATLVINSLERERFLAALREGGGLKALVATATDHAHAAEAAYASATDAVAATSATNGVGPTTH